MTIRAPHLRLLPPVDAVQEAPAVEAPKKAKRKTPPGLYKPTSPCRKCKPCTAKPKRTCRSKTEQRIWWFRKSINGVLYRESTGCSDLRSAKQVADRLLKDWERQANGLPSRERLRLDDTLPKFAKFLTTGRGGAIRQAEVMRWLKEVFREARKAARLIFLDELNEEVYADWLPYAEEQDFANRTINDRVRALKKFGRWLRGTRRLPHDPFEILVLLPDKKDLRQIRRALWPDESEVLVRSGLRRQIDEELAKNAASKTGVYPCVVKRRRRRLNALRREGYVRALVYFTVLHTGLRRDECKKIRICDVQFDRKQIRVSPDACKVGEEQYVRMDPDLARHLRKYIRRLGYVDDTQPLFGFTRMVRKKGAKKAEPVWYSWVPSMDTFDKDLAHAGIEKKDKSDRVVVFHSLRKSYITYLWMDDENRPQDVQRLARHSDLKLTQSVYTDWEMLAGREWAAAERLAGWMRG